MSLGHHGKHGGGRTGLVSLAIKMQNFTLNPKPLNPIAQPKELLPALAVAPSRPVDAARKPHRSARTWRPRGLSLSVISRVVI